MRNLPASALLLAAALFAGNVSAAGHEPLTGDDHPSAGAMAADLLFIRPLGLVSTVLGTALFIVQLPLDIGQDEGARVPFQKLVVEPARFTFARELGSND